MIKIKISVNKIKDYLIHIPLYIFLLLNKKQYTRDYKERVESVRQFLHETFPVLFSQIPNPIILESDSFISVNYPLESGFIPHFNFILSEYPLYICIRGPESSSWSDAKSLGITRIKWEREQAYQASLHFMISNMRLTTSSVKLIILNWEDPVNHLSLVKLFESNGIK